MPLNHSSHIIVRMPLGANLTYDYFPTRHFELEAWQEAIMFFLQQVWKDTPPKKFGEGVWPGDARQEIHIGGVYIRRSNHNRHFEIGMNRRSSPYTGEPVFTEPPLTIEVKSRDTAEVEAALGRFAFCPDIQMLVIHDVATGNKDRLCIWKHYGVLRLLLTGYFNGRANCWE